MPRKNHRTRKAQARRSRSEEFAPPVWLLPKAPPRSTQPYGTCHLRHRKLMFKADEVEQALREAQALRRTRGQLDHMEQRVYECVKTKGGCGAWHLTSRAEWTENS